MNFMEETKCDSPIDCNIETGRKRRKYLEANDMQNTIGYLRNEQLEILHFLCYPDRVGQRPKKKTRHENKKKENRELPTHLHT